MGHHTLETTQACRLHRLSLREYGDWRQLSRARRDLRTDTPGGSMTDTARFEIERVDRHGVVGYHLYPRRASRR